MNHAHDTSLPGFDVRQVLVDGCRTCQAVSSSPRRALVMLDDYELASAMNRSAQWNNGLSTLTGKVSVAEIPLLTHLVSASYLIKRLRLSGYDLKKIK